jgi:hypothetical protein
LSVLTRSARQHVQAIGQVRIEYLASDGAFRGDADVAIARPGLLRFDLRSFFGQPLLALAVDGTQFVYVDNGATRVVRGPADAPQLLHIIPLALPPELTVPLLLGCVPDAIAGAASYARTDRAHAVAIELVDTDAVWRFEVDDRSHTLVGVARYDRGHNRQYAVSLDDHAAVGGVAFPRRGEVRAAGREGTVRWHWLQVEVNGAPLDPALWTLAVPEGYRVDEATSAP